ncbi:MAG: hypothetical protein WAK98_17330 [Gemmobacter sp.]
MTAMTRGYQRWYLWQRRHEGNDRRLWRLWRANQSMADAGPIFAALGMNEGVCPAHMQRNLAARGEGTPAA